MKNRILIALTFLLGMMLTILPLPPSLVWFRPAWVFMILLFWIIATPYRVGMGTAFFAGLWLDLLTGTILGQHAMVLTIIAYILVKFQVQLRSLPLWQQMLLVMFMTLLYLALQFWIMTMSGLSLNAGRYWLPIITTTLLWPWIQFLLKDFQHRFKL